MSIESMQEDQEAALAHLRMGRSVGEVARVLADSHDVPLPRVMIYLHFRLADWSREPRPRQDSARRLGTYMHDAFERAANQGWGNTATWPRPGGGTSSPSMRPVQMWLDEAINWREAAGDDQ